MITPVHIVATGARTAVGLSSASSAAAVRAGVSRVRMHPFMVDARGEALIGAYDGALDPALLGAARIATLATSAIDEVLGALPPATIAARPLPLLLSLPENRPGFSERDASQIVRALTEHTAARGLDLRVEHAGRGHAGVLQGIETGARRIAQGATELCLVGGADSYFDADTLDWLEAARRLKRDEVRAGFAPGEAAAFVLLASGPLQRSAGLPSLALLRGAASATESRVLGGEDDVLGEGLARAVSAAAADLSLPSEAVGAIYCDVNGERYRSDEWGFCVLRVPQVMRDTAYEAPADCFGDVGAASGALGCVLATQAWARGYAKDARALVWASSDGGLRGAAVLQKSQG